MARHLFGSLSLDELKSRACRAAGRDELIVIRDYVRDHRTTRAARAFERDLDKRLEMPATEGLLNTSTGDAAPPQSAAQNSSAESYRQSQLTERRTPYLHAPTPR